MVAYSFVQRLTPNLALAGSGAVGAIAALGALLVPGAFFEDAVLASGIAAFVPAAEPPLGATARICLAVFAGGGAALLAWAGLSVLLHFASSRIGRRPAVRRADAHPDAPPREPLRAGRDLGFELAEETVALEPEPDFDLAMLDLPPEPVIAMGAPAPAFESWPEPEAATVPLRTDPPAPPPVQPLPSDLDQPLAAFDPGALREAPLAAPQPLAPLHRAPQPPVYAEGERFETFDLAPPTPAAPPITGPETVATVHSLLDRLERGIARRVPPADPEPAPQAQGLESTLDALRRMAVRA